MKQIPKIISGGQADADCTALDWALSRNLPCDGWYPKGRKAEDGSIPDAYPLRESTSASYLERTGWNVRDSDGDLANAERRIQKNRRLWEEASEALAASSLEASRVRSDDSYENPLKCVGLQTHRSKVVVYGVKAIPKDWIERPAFRELISEKATALFDLSNECDLTLS
jgi:hypothetical protein